MKKILAIVLSLIMITCIFAFTSCNKDEKVLKMATSAGFPPYEYYENEKITGIDVEIAEAICEKLGYTLQVEDMKFNAVIDSVQSGGCDVGIAGITVTDKRLESVNFSTSYATGVQVIIVNEGSDITGPADLAGKKIGVQLSTTGDIYASEEFGLDENGNDNGLVIKYNYGSEAISALQGGAVDAVIIDNEPAKSFVNAREDLVILETEYIVEEYAIAVSKENTELLEDINAAIDALIADGTIDKILAKYIGAE